MLLNRGEWNKTDYSFIKYSIEKERTNLFVMWRCLILFFFRNLLSKFSLFDDDI